MDSGGLRGRRMRILMLGHKYVPSRAGGVEIVVGELSRRMVARGHQVICCNRGGCFATEKRASWEGVALKTMATLDKSGIAAVTSSLFAALYAAFCRADIVHIHAEGPAFWCWIPKGAGKRVVVTVHGLDWKRAKWQDGFGKTYIRWGEKMAVRFADEIIVLSRNAQRYFADIYGRKTVFIPNGVNRASCVPAVEIRERLGLERESYLLFLGRLVPEKGVHSLIEAFRKVKTEKRLVVAGASDSDAYLRRLTKLAAGDGRILFPGFVQGRMLEELYSNAYLYVLPSEVEGMPLSLLEAMSYGNCCLVSDIPECAQVVVDRGFTFPAGDTEALSRALQKLCGEPRQVQACRERVREGAREFCSWDEVTNRTLAVYENSVDQQVSPSQWWSGDLPVPAGGVSSKPGT